MTSRALSAVGVVIVTYNSASQVAGALERLPLHDLAAAVVVDNDSSDGTPELVESLRQPGVQVVRSPSNDGFGAGCNRGAQALPGARWLLFLNPDARIDAPSLSGLVEYGEEHPDVAVVAPRLRHDGVPQTSAGDLARLRTELRFVLPRMLLRWFPDRRLPATHDASGPVGAVEGACMLVRAQAFRQVGGFDPRYFLFFEEHDLAQRLLRTGWRVHLAAGAWAEHEGGQSREELPMGGHAHYVRSTITYLERWSGRPAAACYRLLCWLSWTTRAWTGQLDRDAVKVLRSGLRR